MADATYKKKISRMFPNNAVQQQAGARNGASGEDGLTCFGIPGSGLPRRHCDANFNVTVAVCSDMTVYLSIHSGNVTQKVFGTKYSCRMYAYSRPFDMYIGAGTRGWEDVQFKCNGQVLPDGEVKLISEGTVEKTYDISVPFSWEFGECFKMSEGTEYYVSDIEQSMNHHVAQNGGFSDSDSRFVNMGALTDYSWKVEMGSSENGKIWLCGGIVYPNAVVDSDITAEATPIEIPGLNMASYYYPGDIQKGNRKSLNRPEGYLRICNPSRSAEYLEEDGIWRDVKNTENDRAVEEGAFENWGFRLQGSEWVRLIITGEGGEPTDGDPEGIGSDSPGGSNGCCCCMGMTR